MPWFVTEINDQLTLPEPPPSHQAQEARAQEYHGAGEGYLGPLDIGRGGRGKRGIDKISIGAPGQVLGERCWCDNMDFKGDIEIAVRAGGIGLNANPNLYIWQGSKWSLRPSGTVDILPFLVLNPALRLLSSRALSSGWVERIYHDPLRLKKRNFLIQFGPKKGAPPKKRNFLTQIGPKKGASPAGAVHLRLRAVILLPDTFPHPQKENHDRRIRLPRLQTRRTWTSIRL
jgi:hypothetical protein